MIAGLKEKSIRIKLAFWASGGVRMKGEPPNFTFICKKK